MNRWLTLSMCVVLQLSLAGCASYDPRALHVLGGDIDQTRPARFMGLPLADGQVVVTESGGPYSVFLALISEDFYPFTHSGIVAIEDGRPYVYEARGGYKPTGGTPADWFSKGRGVRRVSLKQLLRMVGYLEIFDPPAGVDRAKVLAYVRQHYTDRTPFDPHFDYRTQDRVYCNELILAALEAGGANGMEPVPNVVNPSIQTVLDWWGVSADAMIPAGYLTSASYVGSVGRVSDRTTVHAFNAAKKEIHRRFTSNQKLGNVFEYSGGLFFRAPVQRFVSVALDLFDGASAPPTVEEIDRGVRGLALGMFGPIEESTAESESTDGDKVTAAVNTDNTR